jgi:hypothetical protein
VPIKAGKPSHDARSLAVARKEPVNKKLLVLPLALLVAALALTACGGSSGSSGGEESAIETALEEAATSSDPAVCSEVQTEAFNKRQYEGSDPLKACEESDEEGAGVAESVDISNVSVNGESATAEVAVTGSPMDGQTVEVEAVKEGGNWKLNKFVGFTEFDAASFEGALEEAFEQSGSVSPETVECVMEGLQGISQEEAEMIVFEKNSQPVEEAAGGCE